MSPNLVSDLEQNFKSITRSVVSLASSLGNNKEVKDIFIYLIEKIVEPFKNYGMSADEVDTFLRAYGDVVTENVLLLDNDVKITIGRYMGTLRPALLTIYECS